MSTSSQGSLHLQLKERLQTLQPRAFELFAGELLEFMGLQDVSITRYTGDGGIDAVGKLQAETPLLSIPIGVQVKRYRNNVQRTDIDRFIVALSGQFQQGMFITTAGYAPQALVKAQTGVPRVATIDGDQVVKLMQKYRLGIHTVNERTTLDEEYFLQFELGEPPKDKRTRERKPPYIVDPPDDEEERPVRPEEDLITLRALSHALRVDTTTLRRWIEQGQVQVEGGLQRSASSYLFRRDQIESLRRQLWGERASNTPRDLRREFLEFCSSRVMTKSYKPVLLKSLLRLVNRNGEVLMSELAGEFRAFYVQRRLAGLPVEFGPPDPSDTSALNDKQLQTLIERNPLERFLIQGFLTYNRREGVVRFAAPLWSELRAWELLELQRSADQQLEYYYTARRSR